MSKSKNERRWIPWEGSYRVVGEGVLGVYQGSILWTQEAANARMGVMLAFGVISRAWVETYTDNTWKRVQEPVKAQETASPRPLWWEQFYSQTP